MADVLGNGVSVVTGPGVVLKRPMLASLIGSICADWSYLESSLGGFYELLMGSYLPQMQGYEPPSHPVARQVFAEIQTINARVKLVKELSSWVIRDEQRLADVQIVLEKVRRSGKGRNTIAHAVWGICDEQPDALIYLPAFGRSLIYKEKDFYLISEKIEEALKELGRIRFEYYQSRKERNS